MTASKLFMPGAERKWSTGPSTTSLTASSNVKKPVNARFAAVSARPSHG